MSDKSVSPLNVTSAEIQSAPVAYITISTDFTLMSANEKATGLGIRPGGSVYDHLDEPSCAALLAITKASESGVFEGPCNQKGTFEFHVSPLSDSTRTQLWLFDISELRLIQRQLQKLKKPERRFLHQINNLISTTLGYAELVELMLEENAVLSGERLSAVQRYHREIGEGLRQSEDIIQHEKRGSVPYTDKTGKRVQHVLIVHDEPTRVELLVELFQSQQYKVTSFSDSAAATKFASLNAESINLAVLGRADTLAEYLLGANRKIQVLVCSSSVIGFQHSRLHSVADTPLDINELLRKVQEIRSRETGEKTVS